MEAKELMIGDWVRRKKDGTCERVKAILCKEPVWNATFDLIKTEIPAIETELSAFEAIPLTPEILKANGFVKSPYDGSWYIPNHITPTSCYFYVEVFSDDLGFDPFEETLKVICHNVHFLQHALRSNGMTDIADNFKIS